jgi:hypothetical protein
MARTGTKTLLYYVLHQFNRVNPLSLVNRSFHVTGVGMLANRVWWPGDLTVTYVYREEWLLYVAKHAVIFRSKNQDAFAYESGDVNCVSYQTRNPYIELNFYMTERLYSHSISLYYESASFHIVSTTLEPLWYELKKTDISGKIKLLMKHQTELKALVLRLTHCIDG